VAIAVKPSAALLLTAVLASESHAGLFHHHHRGTPPPGRPRCIEHTDARAGDPRTVSAHARPSNGPAYVGYQVGGGTACAGCDRRPEEGTWGWDYSGHWLPRRVFLNWSHGRRYQGGTGSYRVDGCQVQSRPVGP
jgi:hypothetical protein